MKPVKHVLSPIVALALGTFFTGQVAAQSTDDLQRQIEALENELQDLKIKVKKIESAAAKTSEEQPKIKVGPGLKISSPDGKKTIQLTGRLHWDLGAYSDIKADNPLESGANLRRGRLGVKGTFNGFSYSFIIDLGGSANSDSGAKIDEAGIYYAPSKSLKFGFGKMKLPVTFEESISANDISFIERSSPIDMFTDRTLGPSAVNAQMWVYGSNYLVETAIHVRGDTKTSGESGGNEDLGFTGRAAFAPIKTKAHTLHIGGWADRSEGATNEARWGYRSEFNVAGGRPLYGDTVAPLDSMLHWGAELAYLSGPFWAQAEYIRGKFDRQGIAKDFDADGWYAQIGYVIGGAKHYNMKKGAWSAPKVANPFPGKGAGLFELALRYSVTNLGDPSMDCTTYKFTLINGECVPDDPTTNMAIQAPTLVAYSSELSAAESTRHSGKMENITAGLNWYLSNNSRLMFNVIRTDVKNGHGQFNDVVNDTDTPDDKENPQSYRPLYTGKYWIYGVRWQYKW